MESAPDAVVLRVSGELDMASAPKLERELDAVESIRPELVTMDLRELAFIDSTGLRLLLRAAERAREEKRRFVVVRGSTAVDRIFEITGAERQIEVVGEGPAAA